MATSGIATLTNTENNKIFAFRSNNLETQWEIYQNQLELNIHYNKRLQKDWNNFGSDKFEFNIIEEIDDDFLLDDEFIDFVSLLENNYNDFNISSFFFEYSGKTTLIKLFNIIGRDECSSEFLEKLNNNELPIKFYDEIKEEMISLIDNDFITDDEIEDKLNELILEKSHQIRVSNLDMQYKLMNDLEDIVGISDLKEDFVLKLKENDLIEAVGFTIQEKIMEKIFSNNVIDNNIEKQIDSCIKILKDRISQEIIIKLLEKADDLKNDAEFIDKLQNSNLSKNTDLKIINQLKEFIESGIINETNFSQKLYELIDVEIENQWLETKKELLTYLTNKIDSKEIEHKLSLYNIDSSSLLPKINQSITTSIENRKITSIGELSSEIDSLIDQEIFRIMDLKEELLLYLEVTYGEKELDSQFIQRLYAAQLSIDDGKEFISQLSNKISSFKIESIDQIDKCIENLIFERNKFILLNLLYDLVGKEKNNDSFSQKLKLNYLTEEDGNKIRSDLLKLINSENTLDGILDLRNSLKYKLNEMVKSQSEINYNLLINLSNELINSLDDYIGSAQVNDSFKKKLYSLNLGEEYGDIIKMELTQTIKNEEDGPNFELKLNQLNNFKNKGIPVVVDEIVERKAIIRFEEYKSLKSNLISQLNDLIGSEENSSYFENLLVENNLSNQASLNIRDDFNEIIVSDKVFDVDNFNYKYEELIFVENKSIKSLLFELIQKQKDIYNKELNDIRLYLINEVNNVMGKDLITESFKNKLFSNQLSLDYVETFKESMQNFICSDEVFDNKFNFKLDELIDLKEKGVEFKLNELIRREADIKTKELIDIRNELLNKLYSIVGKDQINMVFKFKLVNHHLKSEIGDKIRLELIDLISSQKCQDLKFNYKLAELKDLRDYGVENKVDDVINRESDIYNKTLNEKREFLIDLVNSTIGKNNINSSFKDKLKSFDLEENFAYAIRQELIEFINTDNLYDKKFEVKLDELIDLEKKGIDVKIEDIINKELHKRELILKENLLKELYRVTGDIPLSEEFTAKLNNAEFDEQFGIKIINHFKSEIDSLNIEEGFDFNIAIDEMIYDESKNILLTQTYEIIGETSNSEYFTNKLKDNMISTKMGEDIRLELLSIIDESDLKELTDLRKVTIQIKLDEIILREYLLRSKKLVEIKEKLIKELNEYISNESFKNNLCYKNLSIDYIDKIKKQIEEFINSDDIEGDFEFKVDELIDVNQRGLKHKIDEIVEKESDIINTKFKVLKNNLIADLKNYIWPLDSSIKFAAMELSKRDLTIATGRKAYEQLKDLISSQKIEDSKFTSKYDELVDLKNMTVKTKFIEIINEFAKNQQDLIKFLHSKTIKDSYFNQKVRHMNLYADFTDNLVKDIEIKIKDNEYTNESQITEAIDKYINVEAVEQEKALNKLYDIVGKRGISLKFRARLMLKGLSSDNGKKIAQIVEDKIKTEGLRENKVFDEIDNQLNEFSKNYDNPKPKYDSEPKFKTSGTKKYVFCMNCGHKNVNGSNFCEQCGARLPKL